MNQVALEDLQRVESLVDEGLGLVAVGKVAEHDRDLGLAMEVRAVTSKAVMGHAAEVAHLNAHALERTVAWSMGADGELAGKTFRESRFRRRFRGLERGAWGQRR